MINKTLQFVAITTFLLLTQASQADDFLDLLNAEAGKVTSKATSPDKDETRITDKIVAKSKSFIPKNKTKPHYRKLLKEDFHATYLQYIKLNLQQRELVYERYSEQSFPRIEDTQEAISQLLK